MSSFGTAKEIKFYNNFQETMEILNTSNHNLDKPRQS